MDKNYASSKTERDHMLIQKKHQGSGAFQEGVHEDAQEEEEGLLWALYSLPVKRPAWKHIHIREPKRNKTASSSGDEIKNHAS